MLRFTTSARRLIPHTDKIIELKNKTQAPALAVKIIMKNLAHVHSLNPNAFHALAQICRDPKFEIASELLDPLKKLGLISHDRSIDEITKNVVLSSIEDDGLDINLGSPVTDEDEVVTSHIRAKL